MLGYIAVAAAAGSLSMDRAHLVLSASHAVEQVARPMALAAGASFNNGNLTFPDGKLLPSVRCIEYLVLKGSTTMPLFQAQMQALGLWSRVTVHEAVADPEGKVAGVFRAHVSAWGDAYARGCENALIFEEDAYFNEPVLQKGMGNVEAFLAANASFSMVLLGYTAEAGYLTEMLEMVVQKLQNVSDAPQYVPDLGVSPPIWKNFQKDHDGRKLLQGRVNETNFNCIYGLHKWYDMHSYVISRAAMGRWRKLVYKKGEMPIDTLLMEKVRA